MRNIKLDIELMLADARDQHKLAPSNETRTALTKALIVNNQERIQRAISAFSRVEEEWREILSGISADFSGPTREGIILITNKYHKDLKDLREAQLARLGKRVAKLKRNSHARVVKAETAFRLGVLDGDTLNHIQNLQNAGIHNGRYTLTKKDLLSIRFDSLVANRLAVPTT
jgi:hypothetical protein